MENVETGILLLVVGMTTVFAILLIVISLGKGLITLVNKYAPEETTSKKQTPPSPHFTSQKGNINKQTTAAIVAAVSIVTGGNGKVVKIDKV